MLRKRIQIRFLERKNVLRSPCVLEAALILVFLDRVGCVAGCAAHGWVDRLEG